MSKYQIPPDPAGLLSLSKTEEDLSNQSLVSLTYSNRSIGIEEYLRYQPDTDIIQLRSANQYSLLHIAAVNNQLTICRILLKHLTNKNIHFKEIKKWVNLRTPNGHTAIHFASLNGNLDLISLLEEHEADIYLKDDEGLDAMHFAAQGDQCISLVYFNNKGLSIHARDNKGRTPLHIAAMEGTENAINYLTSRESLINAQCNELGYTPLHYAIMTGNFKIVKRLLIKKADPRIRSKKGESAYELAQRSNNFAIMKILRRKTWLNRILGLQQGLPQTRSWYTFALFFFFYIGITAAQIFFVFPFVEYPVWIILFSIFDSILLLLFLICWLKSPGALKNTGKDSMLLLLQKYDPQEICFDCVVRRPIRSKHCENCETCVSVFDHHCTWTNNCVGAKNHGFFLCLVITALLSLILLLLIEIIHYPKKVPFYFYSSDYTHLDVGTMVLVKNILTITCGFIAFMFILPLVVLNYIQLGNFLTGKTTNERFGTQMRHKESQAHTRESADSEDYFEEKDESQLSKYLGNCWDMCFGNAMNKRYGTQGAYYDDDILVLP